MNAFLLACYICLQLTSISDLNQYAIIKRDNTCDQCLTGIFDHSELMSPVGTKHDQSLLASNPVLKEALEERLMLELSQSSLKSKLQPNEELKNELAIEKQLDRTHEVVEDTLNSTEEALKIMEEIVVTNIKKASEEMMSQLKQQQAQAIQEYELLAAKQRELLKNNNNPEKDPVKKTEEKQTIKKTEEKPTVNKAEEKQPVKTILNNNVKLMAGESLVSENGRYKATLQKNGELVITDKQEEDRIVKKIGQAFMRTSERNFHLVIQPDGNLVIYLALQEGNSFYPTWQAGTSRRHGRDHYLKLEDDGQLVMYNGVGSEIWTSGKIETGPGSRLDMYDF